MRGGFPFGCIGEGLFNPGAGGTAFLDLRAFWSARTDTLGHRIRIATGSHHDGDCFTGADAGGSLLTATPMPGSVCAGDIGAADPGDWYSFGAAVGEEISVAAVPCGCALNAGTPPQPILPMELYDPDGVLRQRNPLANPFIADRPGLWRVRVTTDTPNIAHYEGPYGFRIFLEQLALTALTVNPASVAGGDSSQGAVFFNTAPSAAAVLALSSSDPAVAAVPTSVTVQGSTVAGFTVTTTAVPVPTTVAISASFAGVTRAATLTVNPPAPADTVAVTRAEYTVAQKQLRVEATSTSATATLRVYVTATGELIGTLASSGGGKYGGQFSWPENPTSVTARSSLGGSATASVTPK